MRYSELFETPSKYARVGFVKPVPTEFASDEYSEMKFLEKFNEQIRPKLEANCSEIISIYKKLNPPGRTVPRFIYRGVGWASESGSGQHEFVARIRPNRRPGFLNSTMTKLVDKAIISLGGTATRTNSIFCTANQEQATHWGNIYVVFPKNGWTATFCHKITGRKYMFDNMDLLWDKLNNDEEYIDLDQKDFPAIIAAELKNLKIDFDKNHIANAITRGLGEIMIAGDSYIGLDYKYTNILQNWLTGKKSA